MSSTPAVAVLAQGLRDLRDYAEGPDGEDLRERTGLSAQQIDTALGGEQLPSREVTLALVAAWEGDVEAWRAYWAQIAELAKSESGGGKRQGAPTPPEPSIITPMRVEDAPEASAADTAAEAVASDAEADKAAGRGTASAKEGTAAGAEAVADGETPAVSEKMGTTAIPEPATSGAAGTAVSEPEQASVIPEAAATSEAATSDMAGIAGSEQVSVDAPVSEAARAEAGGAGRSAARSADGEAGPAQSASGIAGAGGGSAQSAHGSAVDLSQPASGVAGVSGGPAQPAHGEARHGEATRPASGTAGKPAASAPAASAVAAETPRKKSALARVGIPVLLFAVGVGVGAFGDHALNSKTTSNPQSASLPTVTQSQSQNAGAAIGTTSPARSSQTSSSSPTHATTSPSSSPSTSESFSSSPTASVGATLGAYSNIQLAAGYSVDFFNDTYHPVPGTAGDPDTMGFFASSFVDGRFYADRVAILDPQDTGTFAACRNNTRYQHDVLLSQVSAGTSFCVHTTTGHLVLVTMRRMPSSTDANPYAVLDLTVWQDS